MKDQLPVRSTVTLYGESGSREAILYRWAEAPENEDAVQLSITLDKINYRTTSERGFFFALQKLRTELETKNMRLAILGCRRNVYPSPIMSNMGDGAFAYHLTIDVQALGKDVVNIFDPCEPDQIASVAEQDAFYESWLKSLRDT